MSYSWVSWAHETAEKAWVVFAHKTKAAALKSESTFRKSDRYTAAWVGILKRGKIHSAAIGPEGWSFRPFTRDKQGAAIQKVFDLKYKRAKKKKKKKRIRKRKK